MEEIIAGEVARWIPNIIAFIFSNLLTIVLIIVLFIMLIVLIVLAAKRNMTKGILTEAGRLLQDAEGRIDAILTSERFRELELGLATGKTGDRLRYLQQEGFALRQEAERLGGRLKGQRIPLFSLLGPYDQASRLRDEGYHLMRRIEQYDSEIRGIERIGDESRSRLQHIRDSSRELAERIEGLRLRTGYPFTGLQGKVDEAEQLLKQAEQSAAFDALQARRDTEAAERAVRGLTAAVAALAKDVKTLQEMKERIKQREEQLRRMLAEEGREAAIRSLDSAMPQVEAVLAQLEERLRQGEGVELRQAAERIETIMKQAADLT